MASSGARKLPGAEHYRKAFQNFLVDHRRTDDGKEKWNAYCPAHETPGTSRPSAEICFDDGAGRMMWYCHVCAPSKADVHLDELERRMRNRSDIDDFISGVATVTALAPKRIEKKAATPGKRLSLIDVQDCCARLLQDDALVAHLLERRGVTEASIAQYDIGWLASRKAFTIPVFDAAGELVNVRLSFMDPDPTKGKIAWFTRNVPDHPLLFCNILGDDNDVVVVEGEWDAILARQLGLNAVTATRGAKKWEPADTVALGARNVTVLMDNDKDGIAGAQNVVRSVKAAKIATGYRNVVHEVTGADFSDMVLKHGWDGAEFRRLIGETSLTPMSATVSLPVTGRKIPFRLLDSRNSGKEVVESTVMANARVGLSKLPWRGSLNCAGDAGASKCEACPLMLHNLEMPYEFDRDDRDHYLPIVGVDDAKVHKHMRSIMGLNCNKFEVTRDEDIDVEHLFVTAPVIEDEDDSRSTGKIITVYMVGSHDTEPGDIIRIVGKCESDAKRQDSVFMAWHKDNDDPLRERTVLSREGIDALTTFRPSDEETPMEKALAIVRSVNTEHGILDRDELGLAYMLVFASVLDFPFRGIKEHGWLQCMVVGDTRTGKTALADRYLKHFGLGSMIKCDVTTRAGLVGGQGSHNGNSFLKMGLLPRSDARLAFLDETTNILGDGQIMKHLTDMRSSGKMSLNMIESGEFRARVRQVWISNPPRDKSLDNFPLGGIQAINELVGSPQDLSRFDFLYAVRADAGTASRINTAAPKRVASEYSPLLCHMLFEWIWTRKPSDIVMSDAIEKAAGLAADRIGRRYDNDRYRVIPGTDAAIKIARLAVAFAALTFSTDNGVRIIVTPDHVSAAEEFLEMMFDDPVLGLGDYCRREAEQESDALAALPWLTSNIGTQEYRVAVQWIGQQSDRFRMQDWNMAMATMSVFDPGTLSNALIEKGLLVISGPDIVITTALRDYARTLAQEERSRKARDT